MYRELYHLNQLYLMDLYVNDVLNKVELLEKYLELLLQCDLQKQLMLLQLDLLQYLLLGWVDIIATISISQ